MVTLDLSGCLVLIKLPKQKRDEITVGGVVFGKTNSYFVEVS